MSDLDDLDSDESEVDETGEEDQGQAPSPPPPGKEAEFWEAEAKKAIAARDKARSELSRTRLEAEYGKDIVELIPTSLPAKERKELAEKLTKFRGAGGSAQQEPGAVETTAAAPAEPPTEDEQALATASSGTSIGTTAPPSDISNAEIKAKLKTDPAAALEMMRAKFPDGRANVSMGRGES